MCPPHSLSRFLGLQTLPLFAENAVAVNVGGDYASFRYIPRSGLVGLGCVLRTPTPPWCVPTGCPTVTVSKSGVGWGQYRRRRTSHIALWVSTEVISSFCYPWAPPCTSSPGPADQPTNERTFGMFTQKQTCRDGARYTFLIPLNTLEKGSGDGCSREEGGVCELFSPYPHLASP